MEQPTLMELASLIVDTLGLIAIIAGFAFTAYELRRSARTAEADHYHNAIEFQKDTWVDFFLNDQKHGHNLLAWHLHARGIADSGELENKKILFYLMRFDVYEEMILARQKRLINAETMIGWSNAIARDAANPDFRKVWSKVSHYYSPKLAELIDKVVLELPPSEAKN